MSGQRGRSTLAALITGSLAFAAPVASSIPADAQMSPGDAAEAGVLDEVVVTAERRTQSLQKSSIAIEVFSGQDLTAAGVVQTRDLVKLSPGVEVGQGGPATQIYIRGVGDFTSTPLTNPAVATYINGIYVARAQSIEGNFFDLDRIEVLKGPQGTLYGRNASGGAINVLPNPPKLGVLSANVDLEGGNYSNMQASAALNVPIGENFALRGAFQAVSRQGYATQGFDDDVHQSGRVQGLWQPNEALSLRISGDYTHIGGTGPAYVFKGVDSTLAAGLTALGIPLPTNPRATGADPSVQAVYYGIASVLGRCIPNAALATAATSAGSTPIMGAPQGRCASGRSSLISPDGNSLFGKYAGVDNRFWNLSAELNDDLGFAKLTVLPAYRNVENQYVTYPVLTYQDNDGQPELSESYSVETRLTNATDALKWVVGTYYFDEHQSARTGSNAGLIIGETINQYVLNTESYAGFAQATYSILPSLRVIGGLRYSMDDKNIDGANYTGPPGLPFVVGQPCYQKSALCPRDVFIGSRTFSNLSYKVGLEQDLTSSNMVYVTVATGEKAGGFNALSQAGTADTASYYRPEQLTAYEAGSRNRFFDDRLQFNVESFLWKYRDAQEFYSTTNASGNTVTALTNAGQATLYGLDADLKVRLTQADTLSIGFELLHSKFDSFSYTAAGAIQGVTTGCAVAAGKPFPTIDCSNRPLPRAPDYSGTASYKHVFLLGNGASIDATLSSQFSASRYLTVDYTPASQAEAYIMGDASLAYDSEKPWSLTAYVHNFNDALVYTGAYTIPSLFRGLTMANLGAPRTFGLRLDAHF
jgi:iron complex outermembrane receptor protein